jgi:uncharacterized protein DUF6585
MDTPVGVPSIPALGRARMSTPFVGDHAVPPEVARAAADSGLGDVQAVYLVPHKVSTARQVQATERAQQRHVVLIAATAVSPPLTVFLLWWATGNGGLGIGVGVVVLAIGFGVLFIVLGADDQGPDRVYVCGDGFVLPAEDDVPPRVFRWTDFTALHSAVNDTRVNGQHVFTSYTFRLVQPDGTQVVFDGIEKPEEPSATEVLRFGPVLEEEVFSRQLPLAVEAVDAGRAVEFGRLAVTASGITTPKGHLPWAEVGHLSVAEGKLALGAASRKPAQYRVGEIPNFQVFWTLAQELRAHHTG